MAAHMHNPSRRALLGAAVALPLVGVEVAPPPGLTLRWARALAAVRAAEAEVRDYERRTRGAPWEQQAAIEEEYGDRLDALYRALRRLLRLPAPDVGAFALKVVLAIDHEVGTLEGGEACLAVLRRDALRFHFPTHPPS